VACVSDFAATLYDGRCYIQFAYTQTRTHLNVLVYSYAAMCTILSNTISDQGFVGCTRVSIVMTGANSIRAQLEGQNTAIQMM
jgi:hypothetical protein